MLANSREAAVLGTGVRKEGEKLYSLLSSFRWHVTSILVGQSRTRGI